MEAGTPEQRPEGQASQYWQLGKNLGACMEGLYDRSLWTDVKFRCKDHDEGERIYAHKVVLAARSPVFQAMFYGAFAETKDEVVLEDAEKKIFDLLLRYVYSDMVSLEEDTAPRLLQMAHKYQVPGLVQICANYLKNCITTENACEMLTLAEFYKITTLKEACCSFIDQNAPEVINSDGFMDLSEECLLQILKGDTFYAGEEVIFAKAEEWARKKVEELGLEQSGANVRKVLGESFYYLRLPTLSYPELVRCTRNKGYLSAEECLKINDFINCIPDTSVTSNLCLPRVPTIETLALNVDDGKENVEYCISCSLNINVSRDVKLLNLSLCNIEPNLDFYPGFYKSARNGEGHVELNSSSSVDEFCNEYIRPCKTVRFGKYGKQWRCHHRKVFEYERVDGVPLPASTHSMTKGLLTVGSLTHNFEFHISKKCSQTINLEKPFILEKRDQPHTCRIDIEIPDQKVKDGGDPTMKMKTWRSNNQETTKSESGHVKVSAPSGSFVKSIKFQTLANRFEESSEN